MALAPIPSTEDTVQLYNRGELPAELARYHEYDGDDDPFLAQCVVLHNKGEIDLVAVVTTDAFAAIAGHDFFTAQHLYCEAIPKLKTDVSGLMKCCRTLIKQAGNDGVATQPNGAFQKWCNANPDAAKSVIAQAEAGDELAREFVSFALRSREDLDTSIRFVHTFKDDRRISGVTALGDMRYSDAISAARAISALEPLVADPADDVARSNAVFAAFDILERYPDDEATMKLVGAATKNPGPQTLYALADALRGYGKQLHIDNIRLALDALRLVPRENLGTVRMIDFGLHRLLATPAESLAIDCLTDLLRDEKLTIEHFNTTAHDLRRAHPQRLFDVVIQWFQSGSFGLYKAVDDLIRLEKDLPFDASVTGPNLPTPQLLFLSRKAIGYLFLKPVVCCSILVALLRIADNVAAEEIGELLFDPMLLNFGGEAKDFLKSIADTDVAFPHVRKALALEDQFHKGLDSTGVIPELHPSDYQRDVVMHRMHDEMAQARNAANSQSIFLSLVRRSTMLYGNRSLIYVEDPGGSQRAVSMELKSFGVNIEMPRREVLDPVGLDYMLRVFRVERFK